MPGDDANFGPLGRRQRAERGEQMEQWEQMEEEGERVREANAQLRAQIGLKEKVTWAGDRERGPKPMLPELCL